MVTILSCVAAALLASVPTSLALKVHVDERNSTPGAHLRSVTGEKFDLSQPGEYVLLRAPREPAKPALIRVDGYFLSYDYAPCVTYLDKVAIHGEWLGNKKVHVGLWNGTLSVKVSSTNPTFAGPWRSVTSLKAEHGRGGQSLGEFPDEFQMTASPLQFRVGPKNASGHAVIRVAQGLREGLDLSISNLRALDSATMAGLLGTEAHEESIKNRTVACEAHVQRMSKHPRASHVATAWSVQPTHLRNLASEAFFMNKPGEFELLRAPTSKTEPALVRAWGTFLSADNASCVIYLNSMTLSGEWLGGKVVHVRSLNGSFAIKVSSADPPSAGTWATIDALANATSSLEALPATVKVTSTVGSPSFQFHLGPNQTRARPSILVAQALHGGLNVSLHNMKSMDMPEIAGLLGTEKHDAALNVRTAACEAGLRRFHEVPGGSSLTASWSSKRHKRAAASGVLHHES